MVTFSYPLHGAAGHHTKTRELPPAVASKDTPEQLYRFWRHRRPRLCLPSQPPPRHQTDINASFRLDLLDTPAAKHQRLRGRAGHTWPLWPMPVSTMVMRTEQTIVYYCATRGLDGGMCTHFWQDEKRSSHAKGIIKRIDRRSRFTRETNHPVDYKRFPAYCPKKLCYRYDINSHTMLAHRPTIK